MAPESIAKSKYSTKSDVYAFGITIIEIFTRTSPFSGLNNEEIVKAKVAGKLHPEDQLPSTASDDINGLVKACTQFDVTLRPDFEQVVEMLNNPEFRMTKL